MSNNIIKLPNVRLSFPDIFEPVSVQGSDERYGASFLLDPENKVHAKVIKAIEDKVEQLIKENWKKRPPKLTVEFYGEGDEKLSDETGEPYQGYEGMTWVSALANKKKQPRLVVRRNGVNEDVKEEDQLLYGGCYVTASIELWAQDNDHGKAIRSQLRGIQFKSHGDAFSQAAPVSDDEFDDEDAEDDLDDLGL